jgi:hypothetical protein
VRVDAAGTAAEVQRVTAAELAAWPEPLLQPEGFRAWAQPPRPAGTCGYDCGAMFAALAERDLLIPVAEPEPWLSAPITYKPWTGEPHRGASSSSVSDLSQKATK